VSITLTLPCLYCIALHCTVSEQDPFAPVPADDAVVEEEFAPAPTDEAIPGKTDVDAPSPVVVSPAVSEGGTATTEEDPFASPGGDSNNEDVFGNQPETETGDVEGDPFNMPPPCEDSNASLVAVADAFAGEAETGDVEGDAFNMPAPSEDSNTRGG
jgi:hypothetical protein